MTVSNVPEFLIEEASKRGQDIFEVVVKDWGVPVGPIGPPPWTYENLSYPNTVPAVNGTLISGGVPLSLAGIAIGPQSTVDRAWVSFDIQKQLSTAIPQSQITNRVRRLSVDSPLYYAHGGKKGVAVNTPSAITPNAIFVETLQGLLYVWAASEALGASPIDYTFNYPKQQETTVLPASVLKAVSGTQTLGVLADTGERTVFMPPLLHLILYLKAPFTPAPPSRFPLNVSGAITITAPQATVEQCIAQIPIFGRKHVKISGYFPGAWSLRAATVRAINQRSTNVYEDNSQTVAVGGSGQATIGYDNPCADYLMVYATVAVASAGFFTCSATDA